MGKPVYLYVTDYFPAPGDWRGAFGLDFVRALMRTGRYRVEVFVRGRAADYAYEGVQVHALRELRLPSAIFPFFFRAVNERRFLAAVRRAGIDVRDVAVCHGNTSALGIYPLAMKRVNPACRTLLHHHDLQSFGLNRGILSHCWLHNVIQYPLLRAMHEQIDRHVFISEASRRSFLAVPRTEWTDYAPYRRQYRGLGFYRSPKIKDSVVLNNGVDVELFTPARRGRDAEGGVARQCGFTIGCVGNFVAMKEQETLIRAVARLNDARVKIVFVGSGERLEACRRLAKELDVAVEFRKEVDHAQLADFYRSLDLFVLPSVFEGFGCVYTEAAACGVPFIGVKGQGIADVAPEDYLVAPHDVEGLAERIAAFRDGRLGMQPMKGEIAIQPLVDQFVQGLRVELTT